MSKILSIIGYDFNKNKFYNKKINNNFTERFKAINELHVDYRKDVNRNNWERISNPSPTNSSKSGAKNAEMLIEVTQSDDSVNYEMVDGSPKGIVEGSNA